MGAAPVPDPHNATAAPKTSIYDLFYRLFMQSPHWVQALAIMALAVGLGFSVHGKLQDVSSIFKPASSQTNPQSKQPIAVQLKDGPYAPVEGTKQTNPPGNFNGAPQNRDATHHIDEDAEHYKFHEEHPEDTPELKKIATIDADNYVAYKFYGKTDKCVYVLRHVKGIPYSQYIKDPTQQGGIPHMHSAAGNAPSDGPSLAIFTGLFDALVPSAAAAQIQFSTDTSAHLQQVQAGCANPHPGPFSWWWGSPNDQCWSPMYRQWRDGCTHYQLFNRCANAWDGRIFWVTCNPNHSW